MIYQSTGGYKGDLDFLDHPDFDFIKGLEFSSGKFIDDVSIYLKSFTPKYNIAIHNYFPVPQEDFVLNLASSDDEIVSLSVEHIKRAIELSANFNMEYYSFHAGFLLDPLPHELGKLKNRKLIDFDVGLENFVNNVNLLAKYAYENNVKLLIENNVCSKNTLKKFQINPLLFVTDSDAESLDKYLDKNVGILCDFAHLKVSANVIGFDRERFLQNIQSRLMACHLSDNDSFEDTNKGFKSDAWFFNFLSKKLNYYSIEVYDRNFETLYSSHLSLNKFLEK